MMEEEKCDCAHEQAGRRRLDSLRPTGASTCLCAYKPCPLWQSETIPGTMSGPVEQHRFLGSMGCVVIWGPSRNCAEICGDCERGLDPAVVIPPEASSTPLISLESLAAAGYVKKNVYR